MHRLPRHLGARQEKTNPAEGQDYGPQRGILIGTKGFEKEDTMIEPPPVRPAHVTDGMSKTACVAECSGRGAAFKKDGSLDALNGAWASGSNVTHIKGRINGAPAEDSWADERIYSEHPGGANVLMADGSVQFMTEDISGSMIRAYCSRNGGETADDNAE